MVSSASTGTHEERPPEGAWARDLPMSFFSSRFWHLVLPSVCLDPHTSASTLPLQRMLYVELGKPSSSPPNYCLISLKPLGKSLTLLNLSFLWKWEYGGNWEGSTSSASESSMICSLPTSPVSSHKHLYGMYLDAGVPGLFQPQDFAHATVSSGIQSPPFFPM